MDQDEFVEKVPFAYHTTPLCHLELIRKDRALFSAKTFIIEAEGTYTRRAPRATRQNLQLPNGSIRVLRDQEPLLREGQLELEPGFTIEALVELIDSHVFFWPRLDGGLSTSAKYEQEERVTLRVPTVDLFKDNQLPFFCEFNSGGPRAGNGHGSPRGPKLFVGPGAFRGPVSAVKEIVFRDRAVLPASTAVLTETTRRWLPLAGSA